MYRISLAVVVIALSGCLDEEPSTQHAFFLEPPAFNPPAMKAETIECGDHVDVGGNENLRLISYTSASTFSRELAWADCAGAVNWVPYAYFCDTNNCPGHGNNTGCRPSVDIAGARMLQECRCYSPVPGVWLCQKYAMLDVGRRITCSTCDPYNPSTDAMQNPPDDAGADSTSSAPDATSAPDAPGAPDASSAADAGSGFEP